MGVFDQAARYACHVAPQGLLAWLRPHLGLTFTFDEWFDTRTLALPGRPERIADLVAQARDETGTPWLLVWEFQSEPDPEKLDTTLLEVALLRERVRHGAERKSKYNVLTILVHLHERSPVEALLMTTPTGLGTQHRPLVWNCATESAHEALTRIEADASLWGLLFWLPLMAGAEMDDVIQRWRTAVTAHVSDANRRSNLVGIALVLAELAGRRLTWERAMEELMTESQVVNGWIKRGQLRTRREALVEFLEARFPVELTEETRQAIRDADSYELLHDWYLKALRCATFTDFLAVLRG